MFLLLFFVFFVVVAVVFVVVDICFAGFWYFDIDD
jgi:hypothetical protein